MSILVESLERAARDFADRPAFVTPDGRPLSFARLAARSEEVAAGLAARGLTRGSVLGLLLPSGVDYAAAYLGAARLGAATAGVNPLLSGPEARRCLQALGADLVAVHPSLARLVGGDRSSRLEALVCEDDPAWAGGSLRAGPVQSRFIQAGRRGVEPRGEQGPAADARAVGRSERNRLDGEEAAVCICFTSGSTGEPKAAWFGDAQLRAVAEMDGAGWGGSAGVSPTQFAHVGFMTKLPWMLASGRTMHLLERWSAGPVLKLIAQHRISAVTGVAPQVALMVRHPLARELDFSAVRMVVAGGAGSPPELVRAARECFGAPYSIRYSSTESGGVGLAALLEDDAYDGGQFAGLPRPGVQAEVRDASGRRLRDGETGELWLKSEAVMSGYWRDPRATSSTLSHGWLRTGDLASSDRLGRFRLAGRFSEMFVRGGYNVHPLEVEAVLAAHPGVREVAVVGRPDPVMGEVGVAVVAPQDPQNPPSLRELQEFAAPSLARYKLPEAITIVGALPRNTADKIDRRRLI